MKPLGEAGQFLNFHCSYGYQNMDTNYVLFWCALEHPIWCAYGLPLEMIIMYNFQMQKFMSSLTAIIAIFLWGRGWASTLPIYPTKQKWSWFFSTKSRSTRKHTKQQWQNSITGSWLVEKNIKGINIFQSRTYAVLFL